MFGYGMDSMDTTDMARDESFKVLVLYTIAHGVATYNVVFAIYTVKVHARFTAKLLQGPECTKHNNCMFAGS